MAERKKCSWPSRQLRAGPAPLASFEDLPSDELESPDGDSQIQDIYDNQTKRPHDGLDLTSSSGIGNVSLGSTSPRTLTASASSTPHIESDFESQVTITPLEGNKSKTPSILQVGSLSSLSKSGKSEEKEGPEEESKISPGSLLSAPCDSSKSSQDEKKRKGSWTDIFYSRSRSRSRSRSPQGGSPKQASALSPTSDKKSKEGQASSDGKKSKFLSLFKIGGRKSPKSVTPSPPHSPYELPQVPVISPVNSENVPHSFGNGHASVGVRNASSQQKKVVEGNIANSHKEVVDMGKRDDAILVQNRKESSSTLEESIDKSILEDLKKVGELEFERTYGDSCSLPSPRMLRTGDEHESSESELTFDVDSEKFVLPKRDSDEDYEAETLLAQSSIEIDDYPGIEVPFVVDTSISQIKTVSRQQRLEVTTIPIERPRSTTPINIAPLEAFIQSASPSPDTGVEKIKLSLPGSQFSSRPRSPKKGSTKSWQDFCEEGLHSPRLLKRSQDDEDEEDPDFQVKSPTELTSDSSDQGDSSRKISLSSAEEVAHFSGKQWVTFEINLEEEGKTEHKESFGFLSDSAQEIKAAKPAAEDLSKDIQQARSTEVYVMCSCECHMHGCKNHRILADKNNFQSASTITSESENFNTEFRRESSPDICFCECHDHAPPLGAEPLELNNKQTIISKNNDESQTHSFSFFDKSF